MTQCTVIPNFDRLLEETCLGSQVGTWFSRARGGAFPFSLPKVQVDGTNAEAWNLCFTRLAHR